MKLTPAASVLCVCLLPLAACSPPPVADTAVPEVVSWRQQLEHVRSGRASEITVVGETIGDEELALLADVPALRKFEVHDLQATPDGWKHLETVKSLEHVVLRGPTLDDRALQHLARCSNLRVVNLTEATFTDEGLAHLKGLADLSLLRFQSRNVTDAGMQHVAAIKSLRFLHLIGIPITDDGLRALEGMTHLESFYLDDARVTDDGLERLWQAIPGLHMHINQQHSDRDPNRHPH